MDGLQNGNLRLRKDFVFSSETSPIPENVFSSISYKQRKFPLLKVSNFHTELNNRKRNISYHSYIGSECECLCVSSRNIAFIIVYITFLPKSLFTEEQV